MTRQVLVPVGKLQMAAKKRKSRTHTNRPFREHQDAGRPCKVRRAWNNVLASNRDSR